MDKNCGIDGTEILIKGTDPKYIMLGGDKNHGKK